MDRREWLKTAGGLLAIAGAAGCSGLPGGDDGGDGDDTGTDTGTEETMLGGGELPAFSSFVGAPEEAPASEPMFFISLDLGVYEWLEDDESATPTPTETATEDEPEDPLIKNPASALITVIFAAGFVTAGNGLQGLSDTESGDPADAPTSRITVVDGGFVFTGSFEVETRVGQVEGAGLTEAETMGEFTIYTSSDAAVGISSDHIVVGADSDSEDGPSAEEDVRQTIQTFMGEADRFEGVSDDHDWCLRTGGNGDAVIGRTTTDDAMDPQQQESENSFFELNNEIYRGAKAVVQSLSGSPEQGFDARAALVYPSADDVDTGDLEAMISAEATSSDVTQAEARVVMEASYEPDS